MKWPSFAIPPLAYSFQLSYKCLIISYILLRLFNLNQAVSIQFQHFYLRMFDDKNAGLPLETSEEFETESAPNRKKTATMKDYVVLSIVIMIKFGDAVELYLPGVITQKVSCDLGLSKVQESLLAVIYYIFHAITILISLPISKRLGERVTLILSLYLSIVFAILCATMPNYSTLVLSRALNLICVGLNGPTSGIFFAKLASSKDLVTKGSFLASGLAMPFGGAWASLLAWLILDLVDWRLFILITSIPIFVPPIILLHFYVWDDPEKREEKEDEEQLLGANPESSTNGLEKVEYAAVQNFTARVIRAALFSFCNLCVGFSSIILVPWVIRSYKADALEDRDGDMCSEVVQGADFLLITAVIGIPNLLGRPVGYFLWSRVKFLVLQIAVTSAMAFGHGMVLLKPTFMDSMILLGLSKFSYSIQGVEASILLYDYDYFGKSRFELGTSIASVGGMSGGAAAAHCLAHFWLPFWILSQQQLGS